MSCFLERRFLEPWGHRDKCPRWWLRRRSAGWAIWVTRYAHLRSEPKLTDPNRSLGVVLLHGTEQILSECLVRVCRNRWLWSNCGVQLRWSEMRVHESSPVAVFKVGASYLVRACTHDPLWRQCSLLSPSDETQSVRVALLEVPVLKRSLNISDISSPPTLKMYPAGASILDDVMLTALMIQAM